MQIEMAMKAVQYIVIRYVLRLAAFAIPAPLLVLFVQYAEEHTHPALVIVVILTALIYGITVSWLANKTAEHMVFEDRKLGAAMRFAVWDLRLRLGFLPFVGQWFIPPSDARDPEEDGGHQTSSSGTSQRSPFRFAPCTTLYCPKCGDALAETPDGHFECLRGQMPLAHELERRFRECYLEQTRCPQDVVFTSSGQPHGIGGDWFCPGCGVAALELTPGDLRCPDCSRSLVEFIYSLVERHPHTDELGKWK